MAATVGFFCHRRFEGDFMHHQIDIAGQFQRGLAGGGITKNGDLFAGRCRGDKVFTINRTPIGQRDGLTGFEPLK